MQLNKDLKFIFSVENFLSAPELFELQDNLLKLDYVHLNREDEENTHYGFGCNLNPNENKIKELVKKVKKTFHPHTDLKISQSRAHLRYNNNKPLPHVDYGYYAFLLYVRGESLFNNGTGFYTDEGNLYHHIGFKENTALFFNANKIFHTTLQSFGESTARYCVNIFYEIK